MITFFTSFVDEMNKLAKKKEEEGTIEKIVHHPATQAAGYGALAGEGAHALAEGGHLGGRAQSASHSRIGRAAGTAALAGGTVFLAAEGIKALKDALSKDKKKGHKKEAAKEEKSKKKEDENTALLSLEELHALAKAKLREVSSPEGRRRAMQRRMLWGS
jgi:hypothetical protein